MAAAPPLVVRPAQVEAIVARADGPQFKAVRQSDTTGGELPVADSARTDRIVGKPDAEFRQCAIREHQGDGGRNGM
jgi:hypothetical protein